MDVCSLTDLSRHRRDFEFLSISCRIALLTSRMALFVSCSMERDCVAMAKSELDSVAVVVEHAGDVGKVKDFGGTEVALTCLMSSSTVTSPPQSPRSRPLRSSMSSPSLFPKLETVTLASRSQTDVFLRSHLRSGFIGYIQRAIITNSAVPFNSTEDALGVLWSLTDPGQRL